LIVTPQHEQESPAALAAAAAAAAGDETVSINICAPDFVPQLTDQPQQLQDEPAETAPEVSARDTSGSKLTEIPLCSAASFDKALSITEQFVNTNATSKTLIANKSFILNTILSL